MRRQPSYQVPRTGPETFLPSRVSTAKAQADERAVLIDKTPDGSELEIGPIATTRGARWTRSETLLGVGLVVLIMGGALLNTLAQATKPKPTVEPPVACEPVAVSSHPSLTRLRRSDDRTTDYPGRTGKTMTADLPSPDDWLLPGEAEGLKIGRGTPLEAISGTACVAGWSVWIVPTRDVLVAPASSMVKLGSGQLTSTMTDPVALPGPPEDGDWTMRVAIAYRTKNDKSIWNVKFFRVVVGGGAYVAAITPTPRPTPEPTPAVTPVVRCVAPDSNSGPPTVYLVVGDERAPGATGAFTWFGSETPPGTITVGQSATMPFEGDVEFQIEGDVCATRWSISSMPWAQIQGQAAGEGAFPEAGFGPQGQWAGFQNNHQDNPIISLQNHIAAKPVGLGQVVVQASLWFEGGHMLRAYWLVRISAFETPPIRFIAPDGTAIEGVVGCGASVSSNDNWYGEECGPGMWPPLEEGTTLTVHAGDIIRVEAPDWPFQWWYSRWIEQSKVPSDGSDPGEVGNLSGSDSLQPGMIRWIVPSPGDWAVRFELAHDAGGGRQYSLPLHIRVRVLP